MKPILLHGHERSLTQIKYNRQGDLLFSAAKDNKPNVWHSHNGERLGTLNGHTGACWCIDVSFDTTRVVSGAADLTARTGKQLHVLNTDTAVRTVNFNAGGNGLVLSTDQRMGKPCTMNWFDLRDPSQIKNSSPYQKIEIEGSKVTSAILDGYDDVIFTGHENGHVKRYEYKTGELIGAETEEHDGTIMDLQLSKDRSMLISASKDSTAKLWDARDFCVLKSFKTSTNVNSAAISPIRDHVILGGGQEAMNVTTTSTRVGKFEVRFFHLVFESEIGRVRGHFGPINTVAFHPDGRSFASGGEDGYVRLHTFDDDYYKFNYAF